MKLSEVSDRAREGDPAVNAYQVLNEARAAASPITTAVVTPSAPMRVGEVRIPDLSGFPAREAVKAAAGVGLSAYVEGTGRLARQEPPAGTVVPKGSSVKLIFEPPT